MSQTYIVFDIGGTTIKYGLIDDQMQLTAINRCSTEQNHDGHILKKLLQLTHDFCQSQAITGIGISTAGIVGKDGAIQYAGPTIPNYQGTPLKEALEQSTQLPVFVVNDVAAALLGEQLAGGAQNADSVYCIALGTGIGGAYVNHGRLLSGAHATANSIGYTLYDPKTKTNYEQRASTLVLEGNLKPYHVSVPEAFELAKQKQQPYLQLIQDWALEVAKGVAPILLLLDPQTLIIGGAVSKQGDYLIHLLQQALSQLLPPDLIQTTIRVAQLADKAQLYGAYAGIRQLI